MACTGRAACSALMAPVRRRADPSPPQSNRQKFVYVKCLVPFQHEIHRPAQLVRPDRQGLAFTVCAGQLGQVCLPQRIVAQKEHRGFREGPLQVYIADLVAAGS